MGKKAKGSRKGKKAWRANIGTDDIEDFFEKSTKDALSGGSLAAVPSDSLFFVDKSSDLSVKRKIEKHREKVLRSDSVLQRNAFVQPVPSSTKKKSNTKRKESQIPKEPAEDGPEGENVSDSGMVDIWDDEGQQDTKKKKDSLAHAVADENAESLSNELGPQPVPLTVTGEAVDEEDMYFIEADDGSDDDQNGKELCENEDTAQEKRSVLSYHCLKILKDPHKSTSLLLRTGRNTDSPLKSHASGSSKEAIFCALDGTAKISFMKVIANHIFLACIPQVRLGFHNLRSEAGPLCMGRRSIWLGIWYCEFHTELSCCRSSKIKRVTRVELNRRARSKKLLRAEAEAKRVEALSKEIDCLPDIIQEIAKEDEEKHKRHQRRIVAKQDRLKSRPPRLGKHKFEPAPVQVLLSEEITGSLRKLKGCSTLARDRYKSLQKRGLLVPTAKKSRSVEFPSHHLYAQYMP
ncbi:Ribosome biogenesis protein NOP53 [Vitis vinifera]|uniref:Ribosome biogenesis protein NOP53 n=1 Tax=Vitis vinifera TaxID=29760 RepID=A0A438J243_VITVI|nr:Ribosome biogenesis protein NOP53 [Vitis vinifera]